MKFQDVVDMNIELNKRLAVHLVRARLEAERDAATILIGLGIIGFVLFFVVLVVVL